MDAAPVIFLGNTGNSASIVLYNTVERERLVTDDRGPDSRDPRTRLSQPPATESQSLVTPKRILFRMLFVFGTVYFANYFFIKRQNGDTSTFVAVTETTARKYYGVPCSKDYDIERSNFKECSPRRCGRVVMDNVVSPNDAKHLLWMFKAGLKFGGSSGGASILDLHTGALSKGDKFINIYSLLDKEESEVFSEDDFKIYRRVKDQIHKAIASEFGIPIEKLFLTKPTFFSRMNTRPAQTVHDEYWHPHIDKETYGSFHYTSLLYLADYGKDFSGGRFVFVDKDSNKTVEPKIGRLSFFTSGSENLHFVEKVESGERYAITVSFTCDSKQAIPDPVAS